MGFSDYQSLDNKLDRPAISLSDASLTVGTTSQTIEYRPSTVQLQTESSTVQKLVTRNRLTPFELNAAIPF